MKSPLNRIANKQLLSMAIDLLEDGEELAGICRCCGETAYECEPDARNYECESCGEPQVFGCEELVMMLSY